MIQLISLFKDKGWEVNFASAAMKSNYMEDLKKLGVKTESIEMNSPGFDRYISNIQPAVIMFDRFMTEEQFGWRVAEQHPDALRILDTEDLHCLRKARQNAIKRGVRYEQKHLLDEDLAKREIASIYRSDLSLIISEAEMDLLKYFFNIPKALIHYLPFMLEPVESAEIKQLPEFMSRKHFIHIGNFHHQPNIDSVLYLKRKIWPLIRKQLPDTELHLYGAYPTQKILDLHDSESGFIVRGRVEDAKSAVKQARLYLAPLRFGAGLKGKLVEAMECGTPSITTEIGAEGIQGDLPWSGFIIPSDQPEEFAEAAVILYSDRKKWKETADNGYRIINNRFQKEQHSKWFIKKLNKIRCSLSDHRKKNFIGSMLMHHTMAGTKYMSRWIEEKNRH
jgi:O-antigen biosynthesis protein